MHSELADYGGTRVRVSNWRIRRALLEESTIGGGCIVVRENDAIAGAHLFHDQHELIFRLGRAGRLISG
jgi:hypothetical protein